MHLRNNRTIRVWAGLVMLALALMAGIALSTSGAFAGSPVDQSANPSAKATDNQSNGKAPSFEVTLKAPPTDRNTAKADGGAFDKFVNPMFLGDLRLTDGLGAAASADLIVAAEWIASGPNAGIYATGRSSVDNIKKLYKYDLAGNFLSSTVQEACGSSTFGWRDMEYDGTNIITADECGVDLVDPATGNRVGGYALPNGALPRSMARNPGNNHCYGANFNSVIVEFDCSTGAVITTYPANGVAHYGFAWDAVTAGGPYLWSWAQQAAGGAACPGGATPCLRAQRLTTAGAISPAAFDGVPAYPGATTAEIAGGVDIETVTGTLTLLGLHQASPNMPVLRGYDLTGGVVTPTNTPTPNCTPEGYTIATGAATLVAGTTDIGNHTDDGNTAITLPFPVNIYGSPVTVVQAGSNGYLSAGTLSNSFYSGCLPNVSFTNTIFPFATDQITGAVGNYGIFTATNGSVGTRQFIIEWRTCHYNGATTCLANTDANYEVIFNEATPNSFEIRYGVFGSGNSAYGAIGTQKSSTVFTQYQCQIGRPATDQQTYTYVAGTCPSATPTRTNTPIPTVTPTSTPNCTPASYTVATGTATIVAGTTDTGNHTDDGTTAIALPFTFNFYGAPKTSVNVSSNGNLQFTSASTALTNACLPTTSFIDAIMPHWDDLRTDQVGTGCTTFASGCGIFTSVEGSAPNRIFNIEWRAVYFGANTVALNFEARLFETSGQIQFIYGAIPDSGISATVGVQQGTGTGGSGFTQFSCNTASLSSGMSITLNYVAGTCPSPTPVSTNTPTNTVSPTNTPICPGSWATPGVYPVTIMDHAVTSLGGIVYSFGGYNGAVTANSYKYDPNTDAWTAIAALPAARQALRAVSDGVQYIYIFGGWDSAGTAYPTLHRYDPVANTYTAMASAAQGASAPGLAYLSTGGGKIYKIGGCIDLNCALTNIAEVYDVTTNAWAPIANYPTTISWLMAVGNAPYVYAAGGTDTASTATAKTYRYDPVGNAWNDAAIADLPDATRWAAASDLLKGKWHIAGGVLNNFSIVTNSVLVYDFVGNTWSLIDPMPAARYRMTGASVGTGPGAAFYAVGGSSGGFTPTNINQRYINVCQLPTVTPCPGGPCTSTPTRTSTFTPTITPTLTPIPPPATCGPNSNYVVITGTATLVPGTTDIGNHTDDGVTNVLLPFTYTLYGTAFTSVNVSSNGNMQFSSTSTEYLNSCMPVAVFNNAILPLWDDQMTVAAGTGCPAGGCGIFTSISGSAPNRIFNVEWRSCVYNAGACGAQLNYEVRLYEASSTFEVIYALLDPATNGSSATVGVQRGTGAAGYVTQFSCNTASLSNGMKLTFSQPSCAPSGVINGQVTWQGVAAANRPNVTGTLLLCVGGAPQSFSFNTDTTGAFTVTTGLADGTYNWLVRGARHLDNSSPLDGTAVTIASGTASKNFGTMKSGNTNRQTDNLVNATDFTNLKNQFGQAGLRSADFDYNLVVNASDFTILKNNFGQAGHNITCP